MRPTARVLCAWYLWVQTVAYPYGQPSVGKVGEILWHVLDLFAGVVFWAWKRFDPNLEALWPKGAPE